MVLKGCIKNAKNNVKDVLQSVNLIQFLMMGSCLILQWNSMETRWDKVTNFLVQETGS